jgi:hypothetical protein
MRTALMAVMLASLAACSGFRKDLESVCHAAERSGVSATDDSFSRAVKIADWLSANVHSEEAKELFSALAAMPPQEKGARLRREAAAHGVSPCPFADEMDGGPRRP